MLVSKKRKDEKENLKKKKVDEVGMDVFGNMFIRKITVHSDFHLSLELKVSPLLLFSFQLHPSKNFAKVNAALDKLI